MSCDLMAQKSDIVNSKIFQNYPQMSEPSIKFLETCLDNDVEDDRMIQPGQQRLSVCTDDDNFDIDGSLFLDPDKLMYQFLPQEVGIYGWRKKILYILLAINIIFVIINLALVFWIVSVVGIFSVSHSVFIF